MGSEIVCVPVLVPLNVMLPVSAMLLPAVPAMVNDAALLKVMPVKAVAPPLLLVAVNEEPVNVSAAG